MLDVKIIEALANLKESETQEIGDYKIEFIYLTLDHIINYQKELALIKSKDNKTDILKFIADADRLTEQVIKVTKKDKDNNYQKVSIKALQLPLAITVVGEWIELNFTQAKLMVDPLETMLERLTGKKIDLRNLLGNLSAVLSTAGTPTGAISAQLPSEKSVS